MIQPLKTPKTKRHFLFYEIETKYSKMYGGRNYVLAIVEVLKKGEIKYLGRTDKKCSRGHMSEESEAWSWIFHNALTPRQLKEWCEKKEIREPKPWSVYFDSTAARELGYVLNQVGAIG
jgi:hypothetical protein